MDGSGEGAGLFMAPITLTPHQTPPLTIQRLVPDSCVCRTLNGNYTRFFFHVFSACLFSPRQMQAEIKKINTQQNFPTEKRERGTKPKPDAATSCNVASQIFLFLSCATGKDVRNIVINLDTKLWRNFADQFQIVCQEAKF